MELPGGVRLQLTLLGAATPPARRGRKPSPATRALVAALQQDAAGGIVRDRAAYLSILRRSGHNGSAASAGLIVNREAKRTFGHSLGRLTASRRQGRAGAVLPAQMRKRRGRKPNPGTVALMQALSADAASGRVQSRVAYLRILRQGGHKGSKASASAILAREVRRHLGHPLGRRTRTPRIYKAKSGAGRKPTPNTVALRQRLATDKAAGALRDATHYVRWLVDHANIGLKKARPVVYRELRAIK